MTNEAKLIEKIKELKEIKPRKDWVLLTKNQILGTSTELGADVKPKFKLFPVFKPVYAGLFFVLILIGLFEFSQNALPGELLYPLKRVAEKSQAIFISEGDKPEFNLELANKRLEELNRIAQSNEVKKLAPAISEFQANITEVARNLEKVATTTSDPVAIKKIVEKTKKLEENKEKVEKVLATKIETEEYDNTLAKLIENQIKDLEERTLTERQTEMLNEVKESFEAGDYSEALLKVLNLSYPQF